ncbi:dihydrolipoyl dehydrogenase [Thiomonas sp.]|jgi:dihydrolipoamide dehydrogenase|uniref:dihydrolipoyl dehydrogenase n=1 Tax=Thiomonas sp. TaxID=2047785 RepID=UPI00261EDE4A|nr:dihydrolipoyl dehydrogenase [Thiomonas sp.]
MRHVRLAIVGAGTAGLTALSQVRKHTDDFVIVNAGPYGTTCARVGCMPSKALIQAADDFHRRGALDALGIRGADALRVDLPAVLQRVRDYRDARVAGVLGATQSLSPSQSIAGRARLDGPEHIVVTHRDGQEERIRADRILIATGTRPVVPAAWRAFGGRVLTTDELFEQTDLPRRLAVVGLGVIGLELGQALARLGLKVHGYELRDTVGPLTDPVIQAEARHRIGADFPLHLGRAVTLREGGDGSLVVDDGQSAVEVDAVLAAMGRQPNIDGLGLDTLGVPLDSRGLPPFDRNTLQIGDLPVYFTGDVNGELQILHEASDEGFIAAYNALHGPTRFRRRVPLAIAFTEPQIAVVGQSWAALQGQAFATGGFNFAQQARAIAMLRAAGQLHVYAQPGSGRLLGAELCVPGAEHLGHLLALAIQRDMTVAELLTLPFYHPVLEEGLRAALRVLARAVYGEAPLEMARL